MSVLNNKYPMNKWDAPIRIVSPSKDQKSANAVRHQLGDLSPRKIDAAVQHVYTSKKIKGQFKPNFQLP